MDKDKYDWYNCDVICWIDNELVCIITTTDRGVLDTRVYIRTEDDEHMIYKIWDMEIWTSWWYELRPWLVELIPMICDAIEREIFGKTEKWIEPKIKLTKSDMVLEKIEK